MDVICYQVTSMIWIMKKEICMLAWYVLLFSTQMLGQNGVKKMKTIVLQGYICNAATNGAVYYTKVYLLNSDSVVIDSVSALTEEEEQKRSYTKYSFSLPAKLAKYILKVVGNEYETAYANYEVKAFGRNYSLSGPNIRLRRRKNADLAGKELQEVVVKATRIKMIHRGDTIIYNADAFNLPDGSMLDALVRQMPGAKISPNGEITVNDKKIDELTLNGRDLFKGNNHIMLDNLPAYVVKDIKVYDKTTDRSAWAGYNVESKVHTMDVVLKRDYNTGLLANIEAAGGTSNRYLERLFGLRYTNSSRIAAFQNVNNVNEESRPGIEGNWDPSKLPNGQKSIRTVGMDLSIEDKDLKWSDKGSATLQWDKNFDETKTSTEQYFSSGNVYGKDEDSQHDKSTKLDFSNNFILKNLIWLQSNTEGSYLHQDNTSLAMSATADHALNGHGSTTEVLDSVFSATLDPSLQALLINRQTTSNLMRSDQVNLSQSLDLSLKLKTGDELLLTIQGAYTHSNAKSFTRQDVNYFRVTGNDIFQNRYNDAPKTETNYTLSPGYRIHLSNRLAGKMSLKHYHSHKNEEKNHYRLDALVDWGIGTDHAFGTLPSNRNKMLAALDATNTYHLNASSDRESAVLDFNYSYRTDSCDFDATLSIPLDYDFDRMHYISNQVNANISQHQFMFSPDFKGQWDLNHYRMTIFGYATMNMEMPDLQDKVDVISNANPLAVRLGNPDLKGETNELAHLNVYCYGIPDVANSLSLDFNAQQHAVAQGFTYKPTTGVYTYRPTNVNGNWRWSINDEVLMWFFAHKLVWQTNAKYSFAQSVDMAAVEGSNESGISKVHNHLWEGDTSVKYSNNGLDLLLVGKYGYQHSTGTLETFHAVNAKTFSYGFTGAYTIPVLKLFVATDMKMYSRRGASSAEFNRDNLIWNVSLSKSFLKGKLTARLETFDLLHQLTNTDIVVNAQGRTETIYNTLPRYIMLHLQWNFNKMPKKK